VRRDVSYHTGRSHFEDAGGDAGGDEDGEVLGTGRPPVQVVGGCSACAPPASPGSRLLKTPLAVPRGCRFRCWTGPLPLLLAPARGLSSVCRVLSLVLEGHVGALPTNQHAQTPTRQLQQLQQRRLTSEARDPPAATRADLDSKQYCKQRPALERPPGPTMVGVANMRTALLPACRATRPSLWLKASASPFTCRNLPTRVAHSTSSTAQRPASSPVAALLQDREAGEVPDVRVDGFVRSVRSQKRHSFVSLGDGSSLDPLQAVIPADHAEG